MPERDLAQLIRGLNPGALAIFKRQLASLPERDRQLAFSRLANVPELSDIIGRPTPTALLETPQRPQQPAQPKMADLNLWQRGLQTIGAPFQWISENITEPFGAYVTSPFTPAVAGTEGMGWAERERAEYKAWPGPDILPGGGQFRPVKGIVETLPWLAVPSAAFGAVGGARIAGALGKFGIMGRAAGAVFEKGGLKAAEELAARGGALGRVAGVTAKVLTPIAGLEALPGKIVGGAVKKVLPKKIALVAPKVADIGIPREYQLYQGIGKGRTSNWFTTDIDIAMKYAQVQTEGQRGVEPLIRVFDRRIIEKRIAPQGRLSDLLEEGSKNTYSYTELGKIPYKELSVTRAVPKVAEAGIPPVKPPIAKITSELFPEGFNEKQTSAVEALLDLTKKHKPLTKETLALRKPEQARRAAEVGRLRQEYVAKGMSAKAAGARAMSALRDEYPRAPMTPEFKKLLAELGEHEKVLQEMVHNAPFKSEFDWLNTYTSLQDLLLENPLQLNQIRRLERVFGSKLAQELMKTRPWREKAGRFLLELANIPRALLASTDASYLLRQGAMGLAGYPKTIKTFAPSITAMFSDKTALMMDDIIRARPHTATLIEHGLPITPLPGRGMAVELLEREEPFMTSLFDKLAEHIPVFKRVNFVRASNRGYVTGLNDMRSQIGEQVLTMAEAAGRKVTDLDLDELAQFIGAITGRGNLPEGLTRYGGLLNAVLFSPKLIWSRGEVFRFLWSPSALVRTEARKTLGRFFGTGAAIITAAKMSGAFEVELDPRSADFGKLKHGDTRLDIWTGYSQYLRFLAQVAVAQRKTEGGRIQQLNRLDVINRLIQTKFSPAMGLLTDIVKGETFLGEEFPPKSTKSATGQLWERMAPLAIQDILTGIQDDGLIGGFSATPGLFGVGMAIYTSELKRAQDKVAKEKYGMSWEELGKTYGRAEQLKLEQTTPAIIEAEKEQERRYAVGTPTTMGQWQKEGQAIEDTYRRAVGFAVNKVQEKNDWEQFRKDIDDASKVRRESYSSRSRRTEYQDIVTYYNQPLTVEQKAKMNPGDVLRREYNQIMYDPIKMFDPRTNEYDFDKADEEERKFIAKYGQQALDYIEDYRGARWVDKPVELRMLEQARELLKPYWQITDNIWSMYPAGLQDLSDRITNMSQGDSVLEKRLLRPYPMILRARELIAWYKKQKRDYNPAIKRAHQLFYG